MAFSYVRALLVAAAVVACAHAAVIDTQVVIIGGGAAGVQAAKALKSSVVTDVYILEAMDRLGGRVSEMPLRLLADTSQVLKNSSGTVINVELGASYLRANGVNNPATVLAASSGIVQSPVNMSSFVAYYAGAVANVDLSVAQLSSMLVLNVSSAFGSLPVDTSVRATLRSAGWRPLSTTVDMDLAINRAVDYFVNTYPRGSSPDAVSARYGNGGIPYTIFNATVSGDRLSQDVRGLRKTITDLAETVFVPPLSTNTRVRTSTSVTRVDYNTVARIVNVTTAAGDVFRAKFAIITASAGVLRANKIVFNPPLPDWKRDALDRIDFVPHVRAVVALPGPLWTGNPQFLVGANSARGSYAVFHVLNWNGAYGDVTLLEATAYGDEALRLEALTDANIASEIGAALSLMFPSALPTATTPTHIAVARWSTNSAFMGGAASMPVGFDDNSALDLAAPVAGMLYFAGEHTAGGLAGTLPGALVSGDAAGNHAASCSKYSICPSLRASPPTACEPVPPAAQVPQGVYLNAGSASAVSLVVLLAGALVAIVAAL